MILIILAFRANFISSWIRIRIQETNLMRIRIRIRIRNTGRQGSCSIFSDASFKFFLKLLSDMQSCILTWYILKKLENAGVCSVGVYGMEFTRMKLLFSCYISENVFFISYRYTILFTLYMATSKNLKKNLWIGKHL